MKGIFHSFGLYPFVIMFIINDIVLKNLKINNKSETVQTKLKSTFPF